MEFYSHKDTLLKDHLKEVAKRSKNYFYFKGGDDLKLISYYIGLSHDFGKYTTFFQKKLFDDSFKSKYSDHSLISSLFSYFLILRNLEKINIDGEIKKFLSLISFFVVIHHHTDLRCLDYLSSILENGDNLDKINNQIKDILENREYIDSELKEIGIDIKVEEFYLKLNEIIEDIKRDIFFYKLFNNNEFKLNFSLLTLSLFSSLIDSDKKSAGKIEDIERVDIPSDIVDIYKKDKFKNIEFNFLNSIREEIYSKVIKTVEKIDLNKKLYTLTSPTGSGKTLTSFSFAIKLRNRIKKELGYTPRIIYSLPFISIINQNFDVINEVLSKLGDFKKNSSKYLLAHHHLSESKYEEESEYKETEEAIQLIESWESEIIITTFVQFLETIIGFKNRFLKKYHNIAKSIILLDEVQNIPIEYWNLVGNMLFYLSKYFDCHVILLTATKPLIFQNIETVELLDENEKYYKYFNRVRLKPNFNIETIDDFLEFFQQIYKENRDKSYMFVLNTIKSSIEFYEKLKKFYEKLEIKDPNFEIYYLSSNVIPKHRIERIKKMKEKLLKGEKLFLVTTQVIEAGVDIDFDIVFRDIAPLDSIIQVAGRCNRENKRSYGELYILTLHNEKGLNFSTMVYGKISPSLTFQILSNTGSISENQFFNLINLYFYEISKLKSQEISENIKDSFINLCFYDPTSLKKLTVSDFKLINDKNTIPVFIEIDHEAKRIWLEFKKIYDDENLKLWERKIKFLEIKQKFEMHLVSPRIKEENLKTLEILYSGNLGYVSNSELTNYYDLETGFIKAEGYELFY